MNNPFHLTRAADLNDSEITSLWVDPQNNLSSLLRPESPLPMIIRGGRGTGKTHLLRYHSYSLQRTLYGKDGVLKKVREAKYLGIFYRCSGLRANRFSQRRTGDDERRWQTLFSFYLELTLGQLLLSTALDFVTDVEGFGAFDELRLAQEISTLFDRPIGDDAATLAGIGSRLAQMQRELDESINMASFRKSVEPRFSVTPGALIFGLPKKLAEYIPCLNGIVFTLFIDEYEHLYEDMQKHVNTLIREREHPVSFKIGVRLHGIKTHQTWGGDEELKRGSDYELLDLDTTLRSQERQYSEFAWQLCLKRIEFANPGWPEGWTDRNCRVMFANSFAPSPDVEQIAKDRLENRDGEVPWLADTRRLLMQNLTKLGGFGVPNESAVSEILSLLAFPQDTLIEKANTFLLYRAWSGKAQNLINASKEIAVSAHDYYNTKSVTSLHAKKLAHFRDDLRDQILMDLDLDGKAGPNGLLARYLGLNTWIRMSDGIIRNLISTLKGIYDWAQFRGENVFSEGGISLMSQARGILEASEWFVSDANVLQSDRGMVMDGVKRIATLLRRLRFSKKPSECSLCRFSVNLNSVKPKTKRIIEAAEMWSLLIRDSDRRARNAGGDRIQYRINPMVAPDYYLPIGARGNIDLQPEECDAIFGEESDDAYERIERERVGRCSPPFLTRFTRSSNRKNLAITPPPESDGELPLF